MTPNSDWWSRAKLPPRPQPLEVRKRKLLATLRKGEHAIMLEKRVVPLMGEELILSVNGHWRRMRVFKPHERSLSAAVANTVTRFKAQGWEQ